MRNAKYLGVVGLALALAACGDNGGSSSDDLSMNNNKDGPPAGDMAVGTGFAQPAGTAAVSFTVDDTANQVYSAGDLQWKGSMLYDPATRIITKDPNWAGPWATLYDDGPWDRGTPGGHEPKGSTAGDHKWGITVFVAPPAMGSEAYEYGLNDNLYQTSFNNGWIWPPGPNGGFMIAAGATTPVTAPGLTFTKFGTTDFRLTIDTKNLDQSTAWDTSKVALKGSYGAWGIVALMDAGNGKFVFTLSAFVGAGKAFVHSGQLSSGDKPEWNFVLGAGDGKEYKDASGNALTMGTTAEYKPSGGAFMPLEIKLATNKNTTVTIP